MHRFHRLILILLAGCCLPSCAFRPAIDEAGKVTTRQPSRLVLSHGEWQFEQIKKHKAISHDPRYTAPVERVANRLKKVIEMPDADWEFVVFKDNSPNAFALSGGKVGINTGLFKIADNDALLAAVLGHEISHAAINHSEQRMYRAIGTVALGAILWAVLDHNEVDDPGYAVAGFALASYLADSLPLARQQEYESDKIGAIYMAKAGYDPRQAVVLWRKLDEYHRNQEKRHKPEWLRTHPLDRSRIMALEDFMPLAMKYYRPVSALQSK